MENSIKDIMNFAKADNAWLDMVTEIFGDEALDAMNDERGEGEEGTPLRAAFNAREEALKML